MIVMLRVLGAWCKRHPTRSAAAAVAMLSIVLVTAALAAPPGSADGDGAQRGHASGGHAHKVEAIGELAGRRMAANTVRAFDVTCFRGWATYLGVGPGTGESVEVTIMVHEPVPDASTSMTCPVDVRP